MPPRCVPLLVSGNRQMRSVQATWQSIVEVEVIVRSVELIAGVDNIISSKKFRNRRSVFQPLREKRGDRLGQIRPAET